MIENDSPRLDAVFRALADPTRRAMLRRLAHGEHSIGELAQPFAMSLAGASKHVKVLEAAGLVRRTVQGRTHRCRLDGSRLAEAYHWLRDYEPFWADHPDAREGLLRADDAAGAAGHRHNRDRD
ncbi:MAG: transcriptional regulator [Proteobacteria bacterium]|nr:MAG: transcriptional regulator [Pseudomonadota bacterium]